jgi:hypothetical protein
MQSEPQIFNKPVIKVVDETTMKIHFDIAQLKRKLPLIEQMFLEELKKIVKHHTKFNNICAMLRTGGFFLGDFAVDGIYKVLVGDIEITLYDVEKVWKGFGWEITSFKGLKVERIIKVL